MKFMDTEPDTASAPVEGADPKEEDKKQAREITIRENEYYAMRRRLEKMEKEKDDVRKAEEQKLRDEEERRLATERGLEELQKRHKEELEAKEIEWKLKLETMELHTRLAPHFDAVFIKGEGIEKLLNADDVDIAFDEMLKNEAYQRYRIDIETTQPKRVAHTGTPPSAGTRTAHTGKSIADLKALIQQGNRDAARELERRVIEGATL